MAYRPSTHPRTPLRPQELALWNTNLRQEGATAVLRALHSNNSLQRLDLGSNELGPEVGREVGSMLQRNTGLEVLDLRNNRLSKTGITMIAESLQVRAGGRGGGLWGKSGPVGAGEAHGCAPVPW